jgi:hypothetical protein
MPFKKGKSGNPGGRPKEDAEVRAAARLHGIDAIDKLVELMNGDNPRVQISAANAILDRGFGKPSQIMDLSVSGETHEERVKRLMNNAEEREYI